MGLIRLVVITAASFLIFSSGAIAQDAPDCENVGNNPFENCGFETGDFTGWLTQDLTIPFFDLQVGPAGVDPDEGLFLSDPPQGMFAALNGFDGNGPGTISIAQDVTMPLGAGQLIFEYQCGWELTFGDPTEARTFRVNIEEPGGGGVLKSETIVTAEPGTVEIPSDAPNRAVEVDVSEFSGQQVRVSFDWFVPQEFTGPAFCQLDNVSVSKSNAVSAIPTLSEWGLIATAGILGLAGLYAVRRRRAAA